MSEMFEQKIWYYLIFAFVVLFALGWVLNIVGIIAVISDPVTGMFILRCIGVFVAPLGAILGYF